MTLKQLGIYKGPIIILNTLDFYKSLIEFLGTYGIRKFPQI